MILMSPPFYFISNPATASSSPAPGLRSLSEIRKYHCVSCHSSLMPPFTRFGFNLSSENHKRGSHVGHRLSQSIKKLRRNLVGILPWHEAPDGRPLIPRNHTDLG